MNRVSMLFLFFFSMSSLFAQTPIDVVESTLKVSGLNEQAFYYGFAEGDQLIFSFEEVNGKSLKELDIIEMPSSTKFTDYETKKIDNKIINIAKTAIYKFRFYNSALGGRVCKFKIQRIPASDATKNFNTTVYTKTIYDTSYYTIQERYLIKSDTIISNLADQEAKVHSKTNANGNKTITNFTLPANTIAWSYYLCADQSGVQAYQTATQQLTQNTAPALLKMPGYGPLAALALFGISYFATLQTGQGVKYWIVASGNENLFLTGQQFTYIKGANVVNDFAKMGLPLQGDIFFCLLNENEVTGINVSIKVTAIVVNQQWGTRPIKRMSIAPRQEQYLKN